jgi:hypothetical protein
VAVRAVEGAEPKEHTMVLGERREYAGRWRRLVNSADTAIGSIHDDAVARSLGFSGGFVPGSTVATAAMPAVIDRYGSRWMEGGWYTFKFISPVYVHEDVQEVAAPGDGDSIIVRVANRDGRVCCVGWAGLGAIEPWTAQIGRNPSTVEELVQDSEIKQQTFGAGRADVLPMLQAAGDETAWYRAASPWGGPVMPPEYLMGVAVRLAAWADHMPAGARMPGMWAEHSLKLNRPLMLDTPYYMTERIVGRGRSGRTLFVTWEFDVADDAGNELARGRYKIRWFPAE